MKKSLSLLLVLLFVFCLVGCSEENNLTLRIYNWQDYIDEGVDEDGAKISTSVMEEWSSWYYETYNVKVDIVYDTFETNEVMLNTLKTGKTTYDLICPSDYTIQKMVRLDMLETFDYNLKDSNGDIVMSNYQYVSPYLKGLFSDKGWEEYSVPYMWGTMGLIYDPEIVSEEDAKNWSLLWNNDYKNYATAKDSVRDTYVVGVMYVYYDELMELKNQLENGTISKDTYNNGVERIMNRCDNDTIEKVEVALKEMKKNIYGYEVDSGKSDIVTGKVSINFAWSGDAVYSLDVAEEEAELYLNYVVPEEGSNVWFDGWVMPNGANKVLAQSFINYLCNPEIAVRNMNVIGYTSAIVGDDILDMIDEWYGVSCPYFDEETSSWWLDEEEYDLHDPELVIDGSSGTWFIGEFDTEVEVEEGYEVDLTYLFDGAVSEEYLDDEGKVIVRVAERGRQFDTQYPDEETIMRCGIMEDFGDQNEAVLAMWESVKIGDISIWITIALVTVIIVLISSLYGYKVYKMQIRKRRKLKKA